MSTAFVELEGSPVIQIGAQGTQATRRFKIAWDDWEPFVSELPGGWRRVGDAFQAIDPLPFPGLPTVVIDHVEVRPFDPDNPDGSLLANLQHGTNRYPHAGALITAS